MLQVLPSLGTRALYVSLVRPIFWIGLVYFILSLMVIIYYSVYCANTTGMNCRDKVGDVDTPELEPLRGPMLSKHLKEELIAAFRMLGACGLPVTF